MALVVCAGANMLMTDSWGWNVVFYNLTGPGPGTRHTNTLIRLEANTKDKQMLWLEEYTGWKFFVNKFHWYP